MVDPFKFKLPPPLVVFFDNSNPASLKRFLSVILSHEYYVVDVYSNSKQLEY